MEKINIYLLTLIILWCVACSENDKLGEIEPLTPDYELPQGKSPADDRIVDYYNQYGSYILYDYTKLDFRYDMPSSSDITFVLPDPQYVGDMLDLLEDIWFEFYSTKFHKKCMPFKLFLSGELQMNYLTGFYNMFSYSMGNSCYLGFCSDTLRKITPATKLQFKNDLQRNLWSLWLNGTVSVPEAFYEVSDYSYVTDDDVSSPNYARVRGFLDIDGFEWSMYMQFQLLSGKKQSDLTSFVYAAIARTSSDLASDLAYPLVKKKYDILRDWLLEEYGFDLQKIGDTTYE